ncbi:hypothetical protein JHK87_013077 [Glycine soja]|nr:hypothetical protein JHK87_013077 [Glycine soja]
MAVAPGYSSQPVLQIQLCNQGQNQFQSAATTPTDFAAVNCWPMQNMQIQNTSSQSQTPANTTSHSSSHPIADQGQAILTSQGHGAILSQQSDKLGSISSLVVCHPQEKSTKED